VAAVLLETLRSHGITTCFTNPGTSELPIVTALAGATSMRTVLSLFEGVCTGAADGYFRVSGVPASTLVHLGPGLANGLANLHNARRAGSGTVNLVGDLATWHRRHDPPLASDIGALAQTVGWHAQPTTASELVAAVSRACEHATAVDARIATVSAPMDLLDEPGRRQVNGAAPGRSGALATGVVEGEPHAEAVAALAAGKSTALYLAGRALGADALIAADRLRRHTGCQVLTEMFPSRMERGRGLPWFKSVPYFPDQAAGALREVSVLVTVGGPEPVTMFGSTGLPSHPTPAASRRVVLDGDDPARLLDALAERVGAPPWVGPTTDPLEIPSGGGLDADTAGAAVCALLPEDAVVVAEAGTSLRGYVVNSPRAARHLLISNSGGSIGMGLCAAVGAAVAAPGRRVVALQADGSALYTPQALWTMAREGLDVTIVLYSNRAYRILQHELERAGADLTDSALLRAVTTLEQPAVDWVSVAAAFGVRASRPRSADEFVSDLAAALAASGPSMLVVDEPARAESR
jgi:acetolactate synthase-1/2/3 large subunit